MRLYGAAVVAVLAIVESLAAARISRPLGRSRILLTGRNLVPGTSKAKLLNYLYVSRIGAAIFCCAVIGVAIFASVSNSPFAIYLRHTGSRSDSRTFYVELTATRLVPADHGTWIEFEIENQAPYPLRKLDVSVKVFTFPDAGDRTAQEFGRPLKSISLQELQPGQSASFERTVEHLRPRDLFYYRAEITERSLPEGYWWERVDASLRLKLRHQHKTTGQSFENASRELSPVEQRIRNLQSGGERVEFQ